MGSPSFIIDDIQREICHDLESLKRMLDCCRVPEIQKEMRFLKSRVYENLQLMNYYDENAIRQVFRDKDLIEIIGTLAFVDSMFG